MRAWLSLGCSSACRDADHGVRHVEEWSDWKGHNTHFASGTHGVFSLRNNKDGSNPRLRTDVDAAPRRPGGPRRSTVSPEQIFQN